MSLSQARRQPQITTPMQGFLDRFTEPENIQTKKMRRPMKRLPTIIQVKKTLADTEQSRLTKQIIILFVGFAFILNGCRQPANFSTGTEETAVREAMQKLPAASNQQAKQMRVQLEKVSFNPPEGFDSTSKYLFSTPEDPNENSNETVEIVQVDYGSRGEPEYTDLETWHDWKINSVGIAGLLTASEIIQDEKLIVQGLPAAIFGMKIGDEKDGGGYTRELVVMDSQSTYFTVEYKSSRNSEESRQRFKRIYESLRLSSELASTPTGDGYVRRYAGLFTVELPENILPKRFFQWDLPRFRYSTENTRIEAFFPDDSANLPIKNDDPKQPSAGELRGERVTTRVETKSFKGMVEKYTVVHGAIYERTDPPMPDQVIKKAKRWARLEASNGTVVVVTGEALLPHADRFDAVFNQFLDSFQVVEQGNSK